MQALAWWRHLALAGLVIGLAASTGIEAPDGWPLAAAGAPLLALTRPTGKGLLAALIWLALLTAATTLAGVGLGGLRLESIDARGAPGTPGDSVVAAGYVAAQPRTTFGELRFPLRTEDGELLVTMRGNELEPAVGERLRVHGRLVEPQTWRQAELRRRGIALELRARRIARAPGGRDGIAGFLDRVRARAEAGVAAGLDEPQQALARGFVLGQDDRIDELTREQFRRSGLAHLLAVSGQNVILLAVLAGVLFAAIGVGPFARLVAILVLIAVYVPVAGGAPSIQRAGVMGAAGIVAGLAGRATDRAYLPLLAAAATLLLNPLSVGEIGWQLSFAAVIGIALWTAPLATLLRGPLEAGRVPTRLARPLAEGLALTFAATLATGPLMAHHFGAVSLASLPANLLALPAVAPVMWLGMLAAIVGQIPLVPTAALAAIEGPLLDYIALIARLLATPDWGVIEPPTPTPAGLVAIYAGLIAGLGSALRLLRRREGLGPGAIARSALPLAALLLGWVLFGTGGDRAGPPPGTLRVTAIDVGQGDSILLQQAGEPAALVDTGPPGGELADSLRRLGVDRIGALFLTHDQLDHVGALSDALEVARVERLFLARPAPGAAAIARAAGVEVVRVGEGSSIAIGALHMQVLGPRPGPSVPGIDPNDESLLIAARFRGWGSLLTGDGESEATGIDPGPIDLLKVAHHGSVDAGLGALLDHSAPQVAMISVGAGNPYGHPTPETLEGLAERGVCVLRTDLAGDLWADFGPAGLRLGTERGDPAGLPGCQVTPP